MTDTVDPLLNDAVDLHVQAVDHRRNPATIAGFQQARFRYRVEYGHCRNLATSDDRRQIPTVLCQIPTKLARILPERLNHQDGRLSAN
jgi:hypothetical protein